MGPEMPKAHREVGRGGGRAGRGPHGADQSEPGEQRVKEREDHDRPGAREVTTLSFILGEMGGDPWRVLSPGESDLT